MNNDYVLIISLPCLVIVTITLLYAMIRGISRGWLQRRKQIDSFDDRLYDLESKVETNEEELKQLKKDIVK